MEREPRFGTKLVTRRRLVCHPRGYIGDRSVRLRNGDQLGAAVGIPLEDEHGFATPGVERVVDLPLNGVLVGSMSLFRAGPG